MTNALPSDSQPKTGSGASVVHLQRLAESSPDIIYRFGYYPLPHIDYISSSVQTVLGYAPEQFYADPSLFVRIIHPEDTAWLFVTYEELPQGMPWVCRWLHVDGRIVWMEVYNLLIDDDSGVTIAVEGIARDITRQKMYEEQLGRANRALRMVLACTKAAARAHQESQLLHDICAIIADNDYALAWVGFNLNDNQKSIQIVARAGTEVDYCDRIKLTWDGTLPAGQGPAGRAIRERTPMVVQHIPDSIGFVWKELAAEYGLAAVVGLPLLRNGETIGLLSVYSKQSDAFDVAEVELLMELADELAFGLVSLRARKDAQAAQAAILDAELLRVQLEHERELSELKSRFIAMASHEFRTPLTAILSSADILKLYDGRMTEERRAEHLDIVRSAVEHLTDMLDDILMVEHGQAGLARFTPDAIDLEAVCSDLVRDTLLRSITSHTIEFHLIGDAAGAVMDRQLIRQIFTNLLNNAMKYSLDGTNIRFDVRCANGWAVFEVEDHGIGIPEDEQQHLFDTFYRARNVGNIPGTGLGLPIVKSSVDLHGGTVSFKSRMGKGTTFIVKLPLQPRGDIG